MSRRVAKLLIEDILEAISKIKRYTKGMTFENFADDEKTIDSVIRNFEVIGEAANQLPDSLKEQHQDIDWPKIVGVRNRVIHEYFGTDIGILWQIMECYLDELYVGLGKGLRDKSC